MSEVIVTIDLLTDGLRQKLKNLQEVLNYTIAQEKILDETPFNMKGFNNIINSKQYRIDSIKMIDDGFQPTYEKVSGIILNNPELYREQILLMKELIKQISELEIDVKVHEERNKNKFIAVTGKLKQNVKSFRNSKKTVTNYYNNLKKQNEVARENFFDSKK